MTNLFVDTNIFLNFYSFSKDHLDKLEQLIKFIKNKEVVLFLTEQVIDEFQRNRELILKSSLDQLDKSMPKLQIPVFCRDMAEIKLIGELQEKIEAQSKILNNKLHANIKNHSLQADQFINEVFELGVILPVSQELMTVARTRFDRGNPPGKYNSYGDAINWELLLNHFPDKTDLHFVSGDKDFKSDIDSAEFSPFLSLEWARKKKAKIFYYQLISSFIQDNLKEIQITEEQIKEEKKAALETPNVIRPLSHGTSGFSGYSGPITIIERDVKCSNCGNVFKVSQMKQGISFGTSFGSYSLGATFEPCPSCGWRNYINL